MNPFDYINAINAGKDIIRNSENPELAEKKFNPFLTNRQFSYFPDTIFFANEMNENAHLDNILQYDFYINTVRPRKRYTKWGKMTKHEDVEAIAEYYGYSYTKALDALNVLSDEQINEIKRKLTKGGLKK